MPQRIYNYWLKNESQQQQQQHLIKTVILFSLSKSNKNFNSSQPLNINRVVKKIRPEHQKVKSLIQYFVSNWKNVNIINQMYKAGFDQDIQPIQNKEIIINPEIIIEKKKIQEDFYNSQYNKDEQLYKTTKRSMIKSNHSNKTNKTNKNININKKSNSTVQHLISFQKIWQISHKISDNYIKYYIMILKPKSKEQILSLYKKFTQVLFHSYYFLLMLLTQPGTLKQLKNINYEHFVLLELVKQMKEFVQSPNNNNNEQKQLANESKNNQNELSSLINYHLIHQYLQIGIKQILILKIQQLQSNLNISSNIQLTTLEQIINQLGKPGHNLLLYTKILAQISNIIKKYEQEKNRLLLQLNKQKQQTFKSQFIQNNSSNYFNLNSQVFNSKKQTPHSIYKQRHSLITLNQIQSLKSQYFNRTSKQLQSDSISFMKNIGVVIQQLMQQKQSNQDQNKQLDINNNTILERIKSKNQFNNQYLRTSKNMQNTSFQLNSSENISDKIDQNPLLQNHDNQLSIKNIQSNHINKNDKQIKNFNRQQITISAIKLRKPATLLTKISTQSELIGSLKQLTPIHNNRNNHYLEEDLLLNSKLSKFNNINELNYSEQQNSMQFNLYNNSDNSHGKYGQQNYQQGQSSQQSFSSRVYLLNLQYESLIQPYSSFSQILETLDNKFQKAFSLSHPLPQNLNGSLKLFSKLTIQLQNFSLKKSKYFYEQTKKKLLANFTLQEIIKFTYQLFYTQQSYLIVLNQKQLENYKVKKQKNIVCLEDKNKSIKFSIIVLLLKQINLLKSIILSETNTQIEKYLMEINNKQSDIQSKQAFNKLNKQLKNIFNLNDIITETSISIQQKQPQRSLDKQLQTIFTRLYYNKNILNQNYDRTSILHIMNILTIIDNKIKQTKLYSKYLKNSTITLKDIYCGMLIWQIFGSSQPMQLLNIQKTVQFLISNMSGSFRQQLSSLNKILFKKQPQLLSIYNKKMLQLSYRKK